MSVEIRDDRFPAVVGESVNLEKLAGGFLFTEGPLWHARDGYLLFSDMPGDHLRKWRPQDGVSTFRTLQSVERPRLGPPRTAARLRALDEPADAHRARRPHHGAGQPLPGQGAEQPE